MDTSSNYDDSSDVGYHPSPSSLDQTETPGFSTSGDSFLFRRTYSETSAFSDPSDPIEDNSYSSEPSPCHWPPNKSAALNQPVLGRLGMKQRKHIIDDQELVDPGELIICKVWVFLVTSILIKWRVLLVLKNSGRNWDDERKIRKAFAWWRHVRKRKRRLHGCHNLKFHNQSLWYVHKLQTQHQ